MALREIEGCPLRLRRIYFRRRGPWGAHCARSGNMPSTPLPEALTRRWAIGPANFIFGLCPHSWVNCFLCFCLSGFFHFDIDSLAEARGVGPPVFSLSRAGPRLEGPPLERDSPSPPGPRLGGQGGEAILFTLALRRPYAQIIPA